MTELGVDTLDSLVLMFDAVLDVLMETTIGRLNHEVVLHGWGLRLEHIEELPLFFERQRLLIEKLFFPDFKFLSIHI